jgi:hypothetical protein
LDPLATQVGRDLRALEGAIAGVLHANPSAGDGGGGIQKRDGLLPGKALSAALHPLMHERKPTLVERSQHPDGSESGLRIDVGVLTEESPADLQSVGAVGPAWRHRHLKDKILLLMRDWCWARPPVIVAARVEVELLFALIHCDLTLPQVAQGIKR